MFCCRTEDTTESLKSSTSAASQFPKKMKYNRFLNRAEHNGSSGRKQKKASKGRTQCEAEKEEEYLLHKCYLVFCLWRRNAVMADLQIDDAHDPALERELQHQWRMLEPDELEAYRRLALLLSSPSSTTSRPSSVADENGHHHDRQPSLDGEACF